MGKEVDPPSGGSLLDKAPNSSHLICSRFATWGQFDVPIWGRFRIFNIYLVFFVAFCLIPMYQKILTLCLAPLKIKVSNFRNSRVSFCSLANHVAPSSERASVIIRLGDSAIDLCYTPTKIRSAFFSSIPIDHPKSPHF